MPCGKRPLVKTWDRPRSIKVIKPSRYQQNEASVKLHWKNVAKELESFYQDDKFWESQTKTVRELVGPVIFERLAKIFNLPALEQPYVPMSELSFVLPSEQFYIAPGHEARSSQHMSLYSLSSYTSEEMGEEGKEEESSSDWSASTPEQLSDNEPIARLRSRSKSAVFRSKISFRGTSRKSLNISSSKIMSKIMSRTFNRSLQRSFSKKFMDVPEASSESNANSADDVFVHAKSRTQKSLRLRSGKLYNPHFELLYCSTSEQDMIKWESKYKKKTLEVSASDEYSKKAELLTKQIANEFYDWWVSVGSADYKSEIKSPADLESLFQIWFDEHASRGLVLHPKILPCVFQSIANFVGVPQAACPKALKRQIAWDIQAETSPAHTRAFNSSLPKTARHIPPQNRTAETWREVEIPEDLKSMTAVWGDISHLTSTKAFAKYLQQHPYLPVPPCLKALEQAADKKQLFVVPSDFVVRDKESESFSSHDLNIPVSEFSLEIKEVLSRLLRD